MILYRTTVPIPHRKENKKFLNKKICQGWVAELIACPLTTVSLRVPIQTSLQNHIRSGHQCFRSVFILYGSGSNPHPGFWHQKTFLGIKNYNLPIPRPQERTSKLQKKPSALKREHPALQNMKFLNFFLLLSVIFDLLDPDSEYGSGSADLSESGPNTDPDPKHWWPLHSRPPKKM
jgi:hypothetical protein